MNFLSHIYLSGDNDNLKIGNFIADGIHGHPTEFHPEIQKGIMLHRAIDSYTDAHPIFRQGTKRLHANYHHYAGVIMDIYYDHFLAKNWQNYHAMPLSDYSQEFYSLLNKNFDILPPRSQGMIPHMMQYNWLLSYASLEGIARTLMQMDHRTKKLSGMTTAINELQKFYTEYEQEFTVFFEDMKQHVIQKLGEL